MGFDRLVARAVTAAGARRTVDEARERSLRAADRVRADVAARLQTGPQRRLADVARLLSDASDELSRDRAEALGLITRARARLSLGIEELQVVARGVHPVLLDARGLDAALETLADECPVCVSLTGRVGQRLGEAIELAAYHLVADAVRAAAQHQRVTSISIGVGLNAGGLWVEVADDAVGDDRTTADRRDLLEVRDRLADLGADLAVDRTRSGGVVVRARLSLAGMPEGELHRPRHGQDALLTMVQVGSVDQTRRAIERDLHDGAQQRLVSLLVTLQLAERLIGRGELQEGEVILHEALDVLAGGMEELTQLAGGIYPDALRNEGLAVALRALADQSALRVDLDVAGLGPIDEAVEVATYFVVSEALTNTLKHAGAAHARVVVRRRGDDLLVTVSDDGRGGADIRTGSGLRGLSDRVQGLGGSFLATSPEGGGTVLTALLPARSR